MFIDTHAHLMFKDFEGDVENVIKRAKDMGIEKIVNIGCDLNSCKKSLEMTEKYDCLYATLGMHPYEALDVNEKLMREWEQIIEDSFSKNKKIVAIGECGLDYFKGKVPKDIQKNAFRLQLELAQKMRLPVIIHNRDADNDTLEILEEFNVSALFHCYGSTLEFARKLWGKGYLTSFTGIITYPSAKNLHEVVSEVPMDLFMIETDCPYLAPQMYRGKRNEPSYVIEVANKIAELRKISIADVERISTENAKKFYRI